MKRCIILLLALLGSSPAPAQEFPGPTEAGEEALEALVRRCLAEGAFGRREDAGTGAMTLAPRDGAKLKAAVGGARSTLTPELLDALIARCRTAGGDHRSALLALLRVAGEVAGDERAAGFAAMIEALRGREADGGIASLEEAARRFQRAGDLAWQAACYHQMGIILGNGGDLASALDMFQKALEIRRAAPGDLNVPIAHSYFNIAMIREKLGEYGPALEAHRKALEIRRAALGEWDTDVANSYHNTAIVHDDLGEHFRALELFRKALEIRRAALGDRHPEVADSYNSIAISHSSLGDFPRALESHRKALEIRRELLGEQHTDVADSYHNTAIVYEVLGEYDRALGLFRKALEIRLAELGDRASAVAASYNSIGIIHEDLGDRVRALEAHLKALEIRRSALGDRHPRVTSSYDNIARLYRDSGEHDRAREAFGLALASLGLPTEPDWRGDGSREALLRFPIPLVPGILLGRGRLLEHDPGPDRAAGLRAALSDYRTAAAVLDRIREGSAREEDKVRGAEVVSDLFPRAVGASARLAAASGTTAPLREALDFAERGAARVFLEGLGRSRALAGGRVDAATLAEEARLSAEIRALDGRIAREQGRPPEGRDREAVERLFRDRNQAEGAWRDLMSRMERDHPQYAALKHPRPCSIAEARACLADDEVALVYVLGSESSCLLVVSRRDDPATGGITFHELPPDEGIAEAVASLTQARVLEDPEAALERGAEAYRMLLAPAAEAIAGRRLLIVPGGTLGQLPFELLAEPGGQDGPRFLVQGHSIRYAPSLTALHMIRRWEAERPVADRALWALGDPVYAPDDPRLASAVEPSVDSIRLASRLRGEGRGSAFGRLAGTGREVERLAGMMGATPGERLVGPEATEAAVKRLSADGTLGKYRYVHFACHGVLGTGEGIQPGLVLGQVGNPPGEDGYLRLDEVTDLRLNADLVALSACQTGQGRVFRAEGVSGLARAFLYAGSRGVLCSLWPVDDAATADLMADTYSGLKSGRAAADALRSAQLKMIEAGEPPLHWAPFVLIGR